MEYTEKTNWNDPQVRIQLLTDIKNVLQERGWTRGQNEHRGRVCLFGARNVVLAGDPNEIPDWQFNRSSIVLEDAVNNYVRSAWTAVSTWNDDAAKSRTEVIKMLDHEIERLKGLLQNG